MQYRYEIAFDETEMDESGSSIRDVLTALETAISNMLLPELFSDCAAYEAGRLANASSARQLVPSTNVVVGISASPNDLITDGMYL